MINNTPDWEIVALASNAILFLKFRPKLADSPFLLKFLHFGFILVFSIISVRGLDLTLMFVLKHDKFVQLFTQPNVLGIGPLFMQWVALSYAVIGSITFITVLMLGNFYTKARIIFPFLILPCGMLYPIIFTTACGITGVYNTFAPLTFLGAFLIVSLACSSIVFYRSQYMNSRIRFA